MTVVVDANILIAFGLADEPFHTQANQLLTTWKIAGERLTAPRLFRSEITAVVRKVVYQGRATPEQGRTMLAQLLRYPVEFHEDDALLKEAYEFATHFNRPGTYDTQYVALADRFQCEFWTADERSANSIQAQFGLIRWLGSWTPPSSP
ncbi:MAG: type II toxin-antitoxin system VapC family toxin [Anaerolineae bacterium]|nr:type II toxin-antitoxin system VapC family toxin [Anaerolineae bacterium]